MIGQSISHYRIVEKLGEGGMGVVYKAEDTKLDRFVALKFLPAHLKASAQDKARFVQEAKAAAALSHPNVCSIIDIQEHDGQMFIVMEFVDGQTLGEKKASLGYKQAVDVGIQVADGLAAAHEKGIVHRDIKPDNIMIRKDGIVQIMDFGLAKLRGTVSRLTKLGSTVGTAGYMSPEQVQGQEADHRSDIFSLGVLLYELFTGVLPFKGVHETALAYEIVNVDPAPMSAVKEGIDPELDRIVLECIEKDPSERYQSTAEISKDLKRFRRESSRQRMSRITAARPVLVVPGGTEQPTARTQVEAPHAAPVLRTSWLPWSAAVVFFLLAAGVFTYHLLNTRGGKNGLVRISITPPERASFGRQAPAVSPDGEKIAFVASDTAGKSLIWVRPMGSQAARPLAGTDNATFIFWSYDGRSVAYFADGKLKRIDANGGPSQTICSAPEGRGGSWGSTGVIVFTPGFGACIQQVSASGGIPTNVTSFDTALREDSHRWPWFLPDGKRFLYLRRGTTDRAGIYLSSIDSKEVTLVLPSKMNAVYSPPGYLLFLREGTLMAQPFSEAKGVLSGEPTPIAEDVGNDIGYSLGFFSASQTGTLVLGSGAGISNRQLVWYDRSGKRLKSIGHPGSLFDFALSPDENRVAFRRVDLQAGNHDLWILDLVRSTESRFTFTSGLDDDPVWAPDGKSLLFDSNPDGISNLHRKVATGAGSPELLYKCSDGCFAYDWSSDGRYILFDREQAGTAFNNAPQLWILPLSGERKPFPFVEGGLGNVNAKFSPDTKWIVYSSNESGKWEVYVQTFPATQGKWQVSTSGGSSPMWSKDGKEIFYVAPNRQLMAVGVKAVGNSLEQGIPKQLFEVDVDRYTAPNRYAVTRDGKRILVNVTAELVNILPLNVVLNWTEGLAAK